MVKSIEVSLELVGHGVVQTDGHDNGKHMWNRLRGVDYQDTKNVQFAKGNYVKNGTRIDANGNEVDLFKKILKISGDGLRHAIHADTMPVWTPNVFKHQQTRLHYFGSLAGFIRGDLGTDTAERRKSIYTITAAEDKDAVTSIEFHSRSGPKDNKTADANDDSVFARESTGATHYKATAYIDIPALQFLSVSNLYGQRAVLDDNAEEIRELLSKNIGSEIAPIGYFQWIGGASAIPERGILLNNEQTHVAVDYLLRRFASIFIRKSATGFAKTARVSIRPICDPLIDPIRGNFLEFFDETGVHENVVPRSFATFYERVDENQAITNIEAYEASDSASKAAQAERRNTAKENKKRKPNDDVEV